jgi:D-alanyl-D-alanine carboxypeptidase
MGKTLIAFPGFVLLVQGPGGEVWSGAAGYSNLEKNIRVKTTDAFHMASITKLFTAIAVLRFVDDGRLNLEDKLTDIINTELVNKIPYSKEISVEQLLDHSSGIYGFNNNPEYLDTLIGSRAGSNKMWTPEKLISLACEGRNEPFGKPGEGHYYGDTNYVLLGLIIERITGRPFKAHIEETILKPLSMYSTYFYSTYADSDVPPPGNPVEGYLALSEELLSLLTISDTFPQASENMINTSSAAERIDTGAGLVTTVHDLHKFMKAVFGGLMLSSSSQSWLLSFADGIETEKVKASRQAVLHAYNLPYGVLITAEGDGPGVNTLAAFHKGSGLIIIAFTNVFGLFDEKDFIVDQVISEIVAAYE